MRPLVAIVALIAFLLSPLAALAGGLAEGATGGVAPPASGSTYPVTQGTSPWVDNITQWGSTVLGAPTAYGTPPSGNVIGVNADVTNFPTSFGISGTLPAFATTPTVNAQQSGVWQVTPTLTTVSTLSMTSSTSAYTSGQLVANNATAGSITNPSFTMPTLGGAIPRIRVVSSDTTSTAWANASIQVDLWDTAPTWTNGDHATWLPATGSAHHIASYSCSFGSAVWGDGLATECVPGQGNYASVVSTTVYWSVEATSGSGVLGGSKTLTLRAEVN